MIELKDKSQISILVSYFLSRSNFQAVKSLGYKNFNEAFEKLGKILDENPHTVKNNRDMFDPYFENGRVGWYQRPLPPSRQIFLDEFASYSDEDVERLVKRMLSELEKTKKPELLKDLGSVIKQSTIHYNQDFVWQDVELREEFKDAYEEYLEKNKWKIEYFNSTSIITTPTLKNIFVPNQWFVIASYAVGVYNELQRYKNYFGKISDKRNEKQDLYAKQLRDNATQVDKVAFIGTGKEILHIECQQEEPVEKAANRLWRFVTDYSWWSGQKTVDRGDFYLSVVLNMLNLVNASQGYVGDIVNAYGSDKHLLDITRSLEGFTKNMEGETYDFFINSNEDSKLEIEQIPVSTNGVPTKHRISISAKSIEKIGGR